MSKTWIKICGLTNLADAQAAIDAGADALGFVFAKSPRQVTPEQAAQIVGGLSRCARPADSPAKQVEKIGVFVFEGNPDFTACILQVAKAVALDAVQVHMQASAGDDPEIAIAKQIELETAVRAAGLGFYKAISLREIASLNHPMQIQMETEIKIKIEDDLEATAMPRSYRLVLDAGSREQPGGTGETFDWIAGVSLVKALPHDLEVVVAGGLHTYNVGEAIARFTPFGVDVSSGVESAPGSKHNNKIHAFVAAVRAADLLRNVKRNLKQT